MFIRLTDTDDVENMAENNVLIAYESENLDISFETTLDGITVEVF